MPNRIKPRRSYTPNAVPTTSDLETHELAINWVDNKAFTKNAAGQIVSVTLGGGGGGAEDPRWEYFKPAAPTSVTATASNAQALISWTAPAVVVPPVTDYVVQYSTNSGSTWTTFTDAVSTATTATITGLTNGTEHVFRVAAVNGIGAGAFSTASAAVTPLAGDPLFGNVALLLHMDGTGSTFVDSSGFGRSITASGSATQSTAQSKFGGKSAAFDGSGDYLSTPSIALGSGDFVVECWLYLNAISSDFTGIFDGRPSQGAYPCLLLNGSNISWFVSSSFRITGSSLSTGQWYHIAVARASGSTRMYVNGTQVGSTYSDSTNYLSSSTPVIGATFDGTDDYALNGYIDELRITVGSSRGMTGSTITVPTAAFPEATPGTDPFFSSVALLLPMEGTGNTFVDSSGTPKSITALGQATQTTAQSRFGTKSAAFDGSGDYLTVANSSGFTFAGDFTIDFWVRFASKPENYIGLFAGSSGATQMFLTTHLSGNNLRWGLSETAEYASGNFTWALNTWYYVAVRRQSGAVTLWVNGTNITSGSPTNSNTYSGGFTLFGDIGSVSDFSGHVDEFRITNGVARTITVPTAAFSTL
jgi:hypothetical protein